MNTSDYLSNVEFGGYLELSLPHYEDPFSDALKFQSGRSALRAILVAGKIEEVFLPGYICGTVIKAVKDSGADIIFYELNETLSPKKLPDKISERSRILCVNYFGLLEKQVRELVIKWGKNRLIIDNSQALFSPPYLQIPSFYSVRKFLGVPDGGLVKPKSILPPMELTEDVNSYERLVPRLIRMSDNARLGYEKYVEAEKSLEDTEPLAMSGLTRRLIQGIDVDAVRARRRGNFQLLNSIFGDRNSFNWILDQNSVPLCYPLGLDQDASIYKRCLLAKNIYLQTYWPELIGCFKHGSIEQALVNNCLYLPCDQRYGKVEIEIMAAEVIRVLADWEKQSRIASTE